MWSNALDKSRLMAQIQFPAEVIGRKARVPTIDAMMQLKRTIRYMQGTRHIGLWLENGGRFNTIDGSGDTDWATAKDTRKSVVRRWSYQD